jgi:cytochrome P450
MLSQTHRAELFASFEWYKTMRATQPVSYDDKANVWHVFKYDDVARVFSDHETFSSDRGSVTGQPAVSDPRLNTLFTMDPPRHREMRGLVSTAFTPNIVQQALPSIEKIAEELLDQVADRGEMDVISDFSYRLPVAVIADLLGVPTDRQDDFRRWADATFAGVGGREAMSEVEGFGEGGGAFTGPDPESDIAKALEEMYAFLAEACEERRRHPKDDLVTSLVQAELEGARLDINELIGFCGFLLSAGHNTTTNLIGSAVLCIDANPGLLARLRSDENLVAPAIEEVLRYLSPAQAMFRFVTKDVVVGGQTIKRGACVFPWMGSANRDEEKFTDPERFDVDRQPNRHLAFGWGIHTCLGNSLARAEGRVALAAMLRRLEGDWAVPDVPLERVPWFFQFGVKHLPLTWNG